MGPSGPYDPLDPREPEPSAPAPPPPQDPATHLPAPPPPVTETAATGPTPVPVGPSRQRWPGWVALAIVVASVPLLVIALTSEDAAAPPETRSPSPSASEPSVYSAHGISMTVPAGWTVDRGGSALPGLEQIAGKSLWLDAFEGPGRHDVAAIYAADIGGEIPREQLESHLRRLVASIAEGRPVVGEPQLADIAGFPSVRIAIEIRGRGVADQMMILVGSTEVVASCTWARMDASARAVCDDLLVSVRVTDEQAVAVASPAS